MAPSVKGGKGVAEAPSVRGEKMRVFTLTSAEGQDFCVPEAEARVSSRLARMIDDGDGFAIDLSSIPARALETLIKYCNKHTAHAAATDSSHSDAGSSSDAASCVDQEVDERDRELFGGLGAVNALNELVTAAANPTHSAAASSSAAAPPSVDQELDKWDRELVDGITDVEALIELVIAAHNIHLVGLVQIICAKVADTISRCKTPKRIREKLRLPDDLTAEEKEEIYMEYSWAFGPDDI